KPLLYNLFGDVEDSASLILTEKDRLNFIEDIIQHNNAIPNAILKHFKDDKDKIILFLGFDFEQWHLRILPKKIFQKEEINAPIFVPYGDKEITKNAMVFYNRQYKMEFLQDEPLEFVKELVDRLDKQDETTEMIAANAPIRVVYLYDQSDSSLLTTLKKHMSSLSCKDAIDSWDDSMILAGEVEGDQITQKLAQANLIILLVSSDFLSSERLYKVQLLEALKRYREGKAFIIPILVRSCAWEGSVFSKSMFILPRNQVPITSWEDQDAAYRNVVIELEKYIPHLVENLQA
ncbi:MAG: SIR2 family protein, partial [Saprospiraceae bacterium]|nr:SIR2 family protein [Saprospiraceae bacterium]